MISELIVAVVVVLSYLHPQIVDTGVLEDVEGLMGGRLGLFCKSQVS